MNIGYSFYNCFYIDVNIKIINYDIDIVISK